MKNLIIPFFLFFSLWSYAQDKYVVEVDLIHVKDDQVRISINTPQVAKEEVEFQMAKIVPGTYSISDFGRFINDFQAFDAEGNNMEVERISTNRWLIKHAKVLNKITYLVHDTFDDFEGYGENIVFEPGGTNIEAERNVFVINPFGFIGYLDGLKFKAYELSVLHRPQINAASALEKTVLNDTIDLFKARDFNFLADGPIMYCKPDISTKKLANAEVMVSVFSPNGLLSSKTVLNHISDLMEAQSQYLGGKLPVDRYAYLIYLMDGSSLSGSMGALEHSYSSLYILPEAGIAQLGETIRDVAAHEFFHIVTPLNIHSREIGNFNYINPRMSKHLWLYEGCTEYAAMHVQAKYGLYTDEDFLDGIAEKIEVSNQFPKDVSFTEMSRRILEDDFQDMYVNVYYKGALIGMCLDLYLLKYSVGKYDLQDLMNNLSEKYGPTVSFEDDGLFDEIEQLTFPEVGNFLRTYVEGNKELPLQQCLSWAGVDYQTNITIEEFTLGNIPLSLGDEQRLKITDVDNLNEFGKAMGYQKDDQIFSIRGKEVDITNAQEIFENYGEGLEVGDMIKMTVLRKKNNKIKKVKLKAKAIKIEKTGLDKIEFNENPTDEQITIRNAWLNP